MEFTMCIVQGMWAQLRCIQLLEPARIVSYKLNQIISDYFEEKMKVWINCCSHLCTGRAHEVCAHDTK